MNPTRLPALGVVFAAAAIAQPTLAQTKSHLQTVLERGTLRVGTTGDFNPMSVRDTATNAYKGFDIEAMEQLAKDIGVKVEWVPTEWATLVAGLAADRYDIFAGGSSLNMARAKTVAFTDPYLEAGTVPLVLSKNAAKFKSWADVNKKGTTVAVLLGTVFEEQAQGALPGGDGESDREAGQRLPGSARRARRRDDHEQHRGGDADADPPLADAWSAAPRTCATSARSPIRWRKATRPGSSSSTTGSRSRNPRATSRRSRRNGCGKK